MNSQDGENVHGASVDHDASTQPPISEPAIRVVMMPKDTNAEGVIFGGVILSLMDQAAYIEAMRQAHHRYVTVSFKENKWTLPSFVSMVSRRISPE